MSAAAVDLSREMAYAADENADAAGLMLADAVAFGRGDVLPLAREYTRARAEANYAWCVYSERLETDPEPGLRLV